jgi:FkbM family methyltransferase
MNDYYVKYVLKNWKHPISIFKRGAYFAVNIAKDKLVLVWIRIGLALVKSFCLHSVVFDGNDVFIKLKNSLEFVYLPKSGGFFGIEFGKTWESAELSLLEKNIKPNSLFLDVGSNFGWYSIHIAKDKNVDVVAFEPSTVSFKSLVKNIRRNNLSDKIKAYKLGLGDKNKKGKLTKNFFLGNHIETKNETGKKIASETIQVITLDEFVLNNKISKIGAIKCDIEGSEIFMLKGACKTLRKFKPILLLEIQQEWTERFEYSAEEIFSFLQDLGYTYFRVKENGKIAKPTGNLNEELNQGHNFFFFDKKSRQNISR